MDLYVQSKTGLPLLDKLPGKNHSFHKVIESMWVRKVQISLRSFVMIGRYIQEMKRTENVIVMMFLISGDDEMMMGLWRNKCKLLAFYLWKHSERG